MEIPVTLTVWNFALPPTPTLVTAFGSPAERMRELLSPAGQGRQGAGAGGLAAVEAQCAQLLSEHRLNATPPREMLGPVAQPDGSFRIPSEQVQAAARVRGPLPRQRRADSASVRAPSRTPRPSATSCARGSARSTVRPRNSTGPSVVFYIYLKDEPNTREDYRYVQKWGRAIREAKSVVKVMVVEQTWTEPGKGGADSAWGDLYGAVDIWCPLFSLHRQDSAAKRQALGETIWTYTALCQGPPTPWWHIDYPLLNYRVPAWMAWRDRMKGLLYWGGMSYWRRDGRPLDCSARLHRPRRPQQGDKGIRVQRRRVARLSGAGRRLRRHRADAFASKPCATPSRTTSTWRSWTAWARPRKPRKSSAR